MKQYAKPTAEENARCKVCFKKFQDAEFFKLCCSCERKVCEDCSASYGQRDNVSSFATAQKGSEKLVFVWFSNLVIFWVLHHPFGMKTLPFLLHMDFREQRNYSYVFLFKN